MPKLLGNDWQDWLSYAEFDRNEAHEAYERGSWREACFHAQQACEKLLKAALLKRGIFRPIHDLVELAEEVGGMADLITGLRDLSDHYYGARYPDAARRLKLKYDKDEALKCLSVMDELWRRLRGEFEG